MKQSDIYAFEKVIDDKDIPTDKKIIILKECIDSGVDINHNNSSALFSAIRTNDYKLIEFLIDCGINVRADNDQALLIACKLFCFGFSEKETMQYYQNKFKLIKLLLSLGVDPASQNSMSISVYRDTNSRMDVNTIILLVDHGANPFAYNNRLFNQACLDDNLSIVKYLVDIGVDCTDLNFRTLSYIFSSSNNLELIKILLDNGLDVNTFIDTDMCLLAYTMNYNGLSSCKLLLEYGADINLLYRLDTIYLSHQFKKLCENKQLFINLFLEYGHDFTKF